MKQKLLIIGGTSLIGSTIAFNAQNLYDIHVTTHTSSTNIDFPSSKLDLIKDREKIPKIIKDVNPDIVIHTVAYPSVDFCEENPYAAKLLHVDITKDISLLCNEINSKLIYFSTDAIFDGKSKKKYRENDITNPLSQYGETKLNAEKTIQLTCDKNIILRTTVVYGWHTSSRFTNWVLDNLRNNKTVNAFNDQNNTPTLVTDLSTCILKILDCNLFGIFHAAGKSCLSRYEFALKLAESFGFDKNLIISTQSSEKQLAPRPVNGCLDASKLEHLTNFHFSNIDEGINYLLTESKNQNI
jgi:dTDP-4-dehydrorhamnose reductase